VGAGEEEEAQLPQVPKPTPARAGTKAGSGKAAVGTKAGAGKAGAGKAAAVPPTKRSSPRFQEEVTSSSSSDIGPPPGFSGNPTPAKAAALVTPKKEVTSSGSSDVGPPPGFQGPPQYNGMQEMGNKGKGKSEVIHCMNLLQILFCVSELV